MKKLNNIKKIQVTENQHSCEFCNSVFKRESTILSHICEKKKRWIDRDTKVSRVAFYIWDKFYGNMFHTNKNKRTIFEFIKSQYYSSFIKFAKYGIDNMVVDIELYFDWLLNNKIKIDDWTLDTNYLKFLHDFLRTEHHIDALNRSIKNLQSELDKDEINSNVFKQLSANKICSMIAKGSISPWLLYNADCGLEFLSSLNESQLDYVFKYIDPDKWTLKMRLNDDYVKEVKDYLLKKGL
jgi:hypothetical protein